MRGATHPLPQYAFMAWCLSNGYVFIAWYLVKHRDDFNFTTTISLSSPEKIHKHSEVRWSDRLLCDKDLSLHRCKKVKSITKSDFSRYVGWESLCHVFSRSKFSSPFKCIFEVRFSLSSNRPIRQNFEPFAKPHDPWHAVTSDFMEDIFFRSWQSLSWLRNPHLYGTRNISSMFTSALHWTISWASWMQSTPSHICRNIILEFTPTSCRLPLPFTFPSEFL
jgi:hypothetical protein